MYRSLSEFLVSLPIEIIKLIVLMSGIFNFELKKDKKSYVICVVVAAVITMVFYFTGFMNPFTLPLTAVVITALMVTGSKKYIYLVLAEITASALDEGANYFAIRLIECDYGDYYIITTSAVILILSLTAYILQLRRRRGINYSLRNMNLFYLIVLIIAQLAIMYYVSELRRQNGFERLLMFLILTSVIFVEVVMIYTLNKKDYYHNLSTMNQKMLETQKNYYLNLLEYEEEIRRFRHDVKNHFVSVEALLKNGKYSEAEEYISGLKGTLTRTAPQVRTGNTVVSAIVTDYVSKFPEVHIEWNGLIPEEVRISNVDICTIFSNILGNAFESADRCETGKEVNVMIETVTNSMIVTVKNNIGIPVKEKDGVFETSKDDSLNHGIGTQNVKTCVKSNGGEVEYIYDDKVFEVKILLPNALKLF